MGPGQYWFLTTYIFQFLTVNWTHRKLKKMIKKSLYVTCLLPLMLMSYVIKSLNMEIIYNLKTRAGQYRLLYCVLSSYRSDYG